MGNDLIFRGIDALTLDDDDKKKEKSLYETNQPHPENAPSIDYLGDGSVKDLQKDLDEGGWFGPQPGLPAIYPEGTPDEIKIDNKYGKYTALAERRRKEANGQTDGVPETTDEVIPEVAPEEPKKLSYEEKYQQFLKDSGQLDNPKLKGYTDERRKKRAGQQQDFYNLAQALRSLGEGVSNRAVNGKGSAGSATRLFEEDRHTPRIQAELQRIRDMEDSDERRVKLANWQSKINESVRKGEYIKDQEKQGIEQGRFDEQMEMQQQRIDAVPVRDKQRQIDELERIKQRGINNASLQRIRIEDLLIKKQASEEEKQAVIDDAKEKLTTINGFIDKMDALTYTEKDNMLKIFPERLLPIISGDRKPTKEEIEEIYIIVISHKESIKGTEYPLGKLPDEVRKMYPEGTVEPRQYSTPENTVEADEFEQYKRN